MSIFFILLTSQTFCLLLAILGVMFARYGLKQKPLPWYNKIPNYTGFLLNLLVVGFVFAVGIPSLMRYWNRVNAPIGEALEPSSFIEVQNISTNPPPHVDGEAKKKP